MTAPHSPIPAALRGLNRVTAVSLVSLILLCLGWELWWAPLRPGGSWLVLKVLPLLWPLFGVLHARRYTHQWLSLFAFAYFIEGVVRAMSDAGASRWLALLEAVLALTLAVSAACFARSSAIADAKVSAGDTAP